MAGTVLQAERIAESPLADTMSAPVSSTYHDDTPDDLVLQNVRETRQQSLISKVDGNGSIPTLHSGFKSFYLRKGGQIVFQGDHLLVDLCCRTTYRHACLNDELLLLLIPTGKSACLERACKETHGATQTHVEGFLVFMLEASTAQGAVVQPLIPGCLGSIDIVSSMRGLSQMVGQQVHRQSKEQNHSQHIEPSETTRAPNVTEIEPVPQTHHTQPAYPSALPAMIVHTFDERRDKEPCRKQGHRQIDDDNPGKIIEILLQEIGKPQNDNQRTYSGEQGSQNGQECLTVTIITVVVHHHHRRINDHTQRYGDACQRIDVQTDIEQTISNNSNQDIGRQRDDQDQQITPVTPHNPHKSEEDKQGKK